MSLKKLLAQTDGPKRDLVEVDDLTIEVREPSYGIRARYGQLWHQNEADAAVAVLLHGCVLGDNGEPGLTEEQALTMAQGDRRIVKPILDAILNLIVTDEKKADAPGTDGVQGEHRPGADAD